MVRLGVFFALFTSVAQAQMLLDGPTPEHRLLYRSFTTARYNPLQALSDFRLTYRHRLYRSEARAFSDNFWGIGLNVAVTPAGTAEGIHAEFAPATVFQVYGEATLWQWFGNFNFIQSFPFANDNWGPIEQSRRQALPVTDPLHNYSTTGYSFTAGALLQGQLGPIAVRNLTRLMWLSLALRPGDRVFYDPIGDLNAPNQGFIIMNDTDVFYTKGRLMLGLRFALGRALYRPEDLAPGTSDPNGIQTRLGPNVAWRFFKEPTHRFNPMLVMGVSWFLTHRYRTGLDVSRALPQIAVTFVFWGDVLDVPPPSQR